MLFDIPKLSGDACSVERVYCLQFSLLPNALKPSEVFINFSNAEYELTPDIFDINSESVTPTFKPAKTFG